MKLLAIIDVAATADVSEIRAQLARELEASWALFAKGILREAYATEAPTRVVFVLEAGDRTQAEAQLRRLPLIASGSFSFALIELRPFVNWSRLFAH